MSLPLLLLSLLLALFSVCPNLLPKLLLDAHTFRYEAGKERGENVFGLLSAEPPGRESGNSHAEAAVSDRAEPSGLGPT